MKETILSIFMTLLIASAGFSCRPAKDDLVLSNPTSQSVTNTANPASVPSKPDPCQKGNCIQVRPNITADGTKQGDVLIATINQASLWTFSASSPEYLTRKFLVKVFSGGLTNSNAQGNGEQNIVSLSFNSSTATQGKIKIIARDVQRCEAYAQVPEKCKSFDKTYEATDTEQEFNYTIK